MGAPSRARVRARCWERGVVQDVMAATFPAKGRLLDWVEEEVNEPGRVVRGRGLAACGGAGGARDQLLAGVVVVVGFLGRLLPHAEFDRSGGWDGGALPQPLVGW